MDGHAGRLYSLDVFRGLTIAGMILVNSPGNDSAFAFLRHSPWHGWTGADLVFPSFLVIMGVSLAISLGRRLERGDRPADVARQAWRRAALIFILGLVMSGMEAVDVHVFRVPGVLQRIALCYLGCSLLLLRTGPRAQAFCAAGLLLGYWLLLLGVPVPGHGTYALAPGGNLPAYLDHRLLGRLCLPDDPEGLLSNLPAMATALVGMFAGQRLRSPASRRRKAGQILAAGLLCAGLGLLWGRWLPINKNLWTSSYALFSGGAALSGLAVCYWLVEVAGLRAWGWPFEIIGHNPLPSYFLSGIFFGLFKYIRVPAASGAVALRTLIVTGPLGSLDPAAASLGFSLLNLTLCVALMAELHRRRIFLKI